jgi:hypothetical protein
VLSLSGSFSSFAWFPDIDSDLRGLGRIAEAETVWILTFPPAINCR